MKYAKKAAGFDKINIGDTIQSPITGDTYELKFIDDFNGDSLNTDWWTIHNMIYADAEEQVNIPENVEVSHSHLIIYGRKSGKKYTGKKHSGQTYTSFFTAGSIKSEHKKYFKFGRIEMLAKLPFSQGMWPAFWTMGENCRWPWGGEIDIMEMVGGTDKWNNYNRDAQYQAALHWCDPAMDPTDAWGEKASNLNIGNYELPGRMKGEKLADHYHVIGIEWTEKRIQPYIDNIPFGGFDIDKDETMREAFFENHFLILNLAIGGSWAGSPDSFSPSVWPQKYMVDWIKVWQIKE